MILPPKNKALIDFAQSFVGVHETSPNSGPFIEKFQSVMGKPHKEPWCVEFVRYCVEEIDRRFGTKTLLYKSASSQEVLNKTPQVAKITWPEPGCVVIWTLFDQAGKPTQFGHAGIIKEVLDPNWMITIEGNTSPGPGIEREGDGVYMKRRHTKWIAGPLHVAGFLMPWAH
jgi:hypothetical protein